MAQYLTACSQDDCHNLWILLVAVHVWVAVEAQLSNLEQLINVKSADLLHFYFLV